LRNSRIFKARDYIGAIFMIAAMVLLVPLTVLQAWGLREPWLTVLAVLGLVPAIDAAVALVNRSVTRGLAATIIPGLALREGIPSDLRTMVVVPSLLTSPASVQEQIERLEIHYLASPDVELHFALLTDWTDAPTEHTDGDAALLDVAIEGIARLNRLHGPAPAGERFILLSPPTGLQQRPKHWMGWERSAASCTS